MKQLNVLLAEDNPADAYLVERALQVNRIDYKLRVLSDGAQATKFINELEQLHDEWCPDIFLLDLNLPKGDGHEILRNFRAHSRCSRVPVVIITSSDSPADRSRAQTLGASHYFRKPSDLDEFMKLGEVVEKLAGQAER